MFNVVWQAKSSCGASEGPASRGRIGLEGTVAIPKELKWTVKGLSSPVWRMNVCFVVIAPLLQINWEWHWWVECLSLIRVSMIIIIELESNFIGPNKRSTKGFISNCKVCWQHEFSWTRELISLRNFPKTPWKVIKVNPFYSKNLPYSVDFSNINEFESTSTITLNTRLWNNLTRYVILEILI